MKEGNWEVPHHDPRTGQPRQRCKKDRPRDRPRQKRRV